MGLKLLAVAAVVSSGSTLFLKLNVMLFKHGLTQVIFGIFLTLMAHLLAVLVLGLAMYALESLRSVSGFLGPLLGVINALLLYSLLVIGVSQLLYILPLVLWLQQRRKWGLMQGVILGALLTAGLNGWALLTLFTAFK